MGRIHRPDPEHGIHHVFSRGTRRWTLFIDELDYERFIMRLGTVCIRYGVRVYAYCLMGNHFHLALYCPDGQVSLAMRDLKSSYALMHNQRHGFSGPLFESRFGSRLVMSHEYLQILVRYIHRNPASIDPSCPLELYRWSSHAFYLDPTIERPEWFDIEFPRRLFGRPQDYRRFIEHNLESDKTHVAPDLVLQPSGSPSMPRRPSISTILLLVAAAAECEVANIRPRMRHGLAGLVALLAFECAGYTSAELKDPCGFASPQSVAAARVRTRKRLASDLHLRSIHDQARAGLANDG